MDATSGAVAVAWTAATLGPQGPVAPGVGRGPGLPLALPGLHYTLTLHGDSKGPALHSVTVAAAGALVPRGTGWVYQAQALAALDVSALPLGSRAVVCVAGHDTDSGQALGPVCSHPTPLLRSSVDVCGV